MKKKYVKPEIEMIDIITHDLCAGSNYCNTIDLKVLDLKKEQKKTYLFGKGDTKDLWDSKY